MYYGSYFDWLCDIINLKPGMYDILMHELYTIEFYWIIDLDSNRADDVHVLRGYFHDSYGYENAFMEKPCSVLEILICLAQKINFILDDDDRGDRTRIWFWEMLSNLKLDKFNDASFDKSFGQDMSRLNEIRKICDRWLSRKFSYAGFGSPFPLFDPRRDQRKLQMIDQINDYILAKYMINDELL